MVDVQYFGFDGMVHSGQIVVCESLRGEVKMIFKEILDLEFPLESVIPISNRRFCENDRWSDRLSMEANNSSGFNYRFIANSDKLSQHAFGRAVDLNPRTNPVLVEGKVTAPTNGVYDPEMPGTLYNGHPVVDVFKRFGWIWGGDWKSLQDYQHFEKP